MAHRVVDELGTVDQPLPRAAGSGHVDAGIVCPRSVCRAAGEDTTRSLRQIGMGARAHGLGHRHAVEDTRRGGDGGAFG